jgi:hypothetical protein
MSLWGSEVENIEVASLHQMLNALFDKKLAKLESKASGIVKEMNSVRRQFLDACDRFEKLDAMPDTEDIYNPNINSIKTQKDLYARSIRKVIGDLQTATEGAQNTYERYARILANVESSNTEMLRTNARFRIVLHCYAKHLGGFKRSESDLEKLIAAMKNELERRGAELYEYNKVNDQILELRLRLDELHNLENRNKALGAGSARNISASIDRDESETASMLESKREEERTVSSQVADLNSAITSLVAPLEKAAKKFDHMSTSKKQLHRLVSDAANTIGDESGYLEFMAMVKELKERLDEGKISVKNHDAVSSAAERLLDSDIYSMIKSVRSANERKRKMEADIANLKMEMNHIKSYRENTEKTVNSIEEMKKIISDVQGSMSYSKTAVEKSFLEHYGKRIRIALL